MAVKKLTNYQLDQLAGALQDLKGAVSIRPWKLVYAINKNLSKFRSVLKPVYESLDDYKKEHVKFDEKKGVYITKKDGDKTVFVCKSKKDEEQYLDKWSKLFNSDSDISIKDIHKVANEVMENVEVNGDVSGMELIIEYFIED